MRRFCATNRPMTMPPSHHRLLLTGAAGGLGQALRGRLKANCQVLRLSDVVDMGAPQAGEEIVTADLADAKAVQAMMAGVDAVVHLGGVSTEQPWAPILQACMKLPGSTGCAAWCLPAPTM